MPRSSKILQVTIVLLDDVCLTVMLNACDYTRLSLKICPTGARSVYMIHHLFMVQLIRHDHSCL